MTAADLMSRLRAHGCYVGKEALAEIERLNAIHAAWHEKWERMACEYCGSVMSPGHAAILDFLLDTRDPLSRSGHCIFCTQRVGMSVYGSELLNPQRHLKGCAWLARQLRQDEQ